jgi:hypothetical protein
MTTPEPANVDTAESKRMQLPSTVLLGLCAAILVARRPDALTHAQFWAEDGNIFFLQDRELGWRAVLEPYAGYLHLIPRLVAAAAGMLDPTHAPLIYALVAGAGTLHVCALPLLRALPSWGNWAGAAALAVVLVPDAREVLWVLTNLQWVMAPGLMLLALGTPPAGTAGRVHDVLMTLLAGLTGPLVVVIAPLFCWRAWRSRTAHATVLAAVAVSAALLQGTLAAGHLQVRPQLWSDWPMLGAAAGLRVWDALLLGGRLTQPGHLAIGWLLLLAGAAACLRGLRPATSGAAERAALLGLAAVMLGLGLLRCQEFAPLLFQPGNGSRYFFPSLVLLLWFGISVFAQSGPRGRLGAAALVGAFSGSNLTRWREAPLPDLGWENVAAEIRAGRTVDAPLHPNWRLRIPGAAETAATAPGGGPPTTPMAPALVASLSASDPELRPEGERLALHGRVAVPPGESSLTWEILLPPHWVLLQVEGDPSIPLAPRPGTSGLIRLRHERPPAGPLALTVWVSYPPDAPAARLESRVIRPHPAGEQVQHLPILSWRGRRS